MESKRGLEPNHPLETYNPAKALTVTELTFLIKELLESSFKTLWVEGEVSNFTSPFSGHHYFVLKDQQSQIRCVMFRQQAKALRFTPENGTKVLVKGAINVYMPRGEYQLIVEHMEPLGIGALALALEQLKKKLMAEGVFDEKKKRPIPYLPQRVAVITSPTGAAIRDFLKVITRRFSDINIVIVPVRVQGEEATADIVNAFHIVNSNLDVDVIVITRGGGSLEDLWPFNQEALAYAIRESNIPVVSAVGHEVDWTICDMASDMRAPTPSAAAELLVREKLILETHIKELSSRLISNMATRLPGQKSRLYDLQERIKKFSKTLNYTWQTLDDLNSRLQYAALGMVNLRRQRVLTIVKSLNYLSPVRVFQDKKERFIATRKRLIDVMCYLLRDLKGMLEAKKSHLRAVSPLNILNRGYSITIRLMDGSVIKDSTDLNVGEKIKNIYSRGSTVSVIKQVKQVIK